MRKNVLFISAFSFFLFGFFDGVCSTRDECPQASFKQSIIQVVMKVDTLPPEDVMAVIEHVINATNNFNIEDVANLYTPNAVIADDEPPYSWNGPTAGVQWVNAIEQICKDNKLTKLKSSIATVTIFQQSADNVYLVVPVSYTGNLPGKTLFTADGAFTFVLRNINGKWMVKSQAWMPRKAI